MLPQSVGWTYVRSPFARKLGGLIAVLLLSVLTTGARAQTAEQVAGARAAATEGAKAFNEGRFQEAIDLFQRAESLVHAPPHLLFMARAYEKLGKLVKASELYNKIIREELSEDAPNAFKEAQRSAQQEIQQVKPRLARLTVKVNAPAGVEYTVVMDGNELPAPLLGVPMPVDPGKHVLQAKAEGYTSDLETIVLQEGLSGRTTLELRALPGQAQPAAEPALGSTRAGASPADTLPASETGSSLAAPAYVALGVGAVGVGAGVFFTLQSASKHDDADDKFGKCQSRGVGGVCREEDPLTSEIEDLYDEAGNARTLATVGYIAGGVGVALGVTLLILDGSSKQESAKGLEVTPYIGYQSLGLKGVF